MMMAELDTEKVLKDRKLEIYTLFIYKEVVYKKVVLDWPKP